MTLKEIKERAIQILTDKTYARVYFTLPQIDWEELRRRIIEILPDKRGELGNPKDKVEAIAEMILPDIIAFFQSEEGKKVLQNGKRNKKRSRKGKAVKHERSYLIWVYLY